MTASFMRIVVLLCVYDKQVHGSSCVFAFHLTSVLWPCSVPHDAYDPGCSAMAHVVPLLLCACVVVCVSFVFVFPHTPCRLALDDEKKKSTSCSIGSAE